MEIRKSNEKEYTVILSKEDVDNVIKIFKELTPNYDRYLPMQNDDLWNKLVIRHTVDRLLDKIEFKENAPVILTIVNGNEKYILSVTNVKQVLDENNKVIGIM